MKWQLSSRTFAFVGVFAALLTLLTGAFQPQSTSAAAVQWQTTGFCGTSNNSYFVNSDLKYGILYGQQMGYCNSLRGNSQGLVEGVFNPARTGNRLEIYTAEQGAASTVYMQVKIEFTDGTSWTPLPITINGLGRTNHYFDLAGSAYAGKYVTYVTIYLTNGSGGALGVDNVAIFY